MITELPLRAAVIGCGRIGTGFSSSRGDGAILTHAAAYAATPLTELVAVCDRDAEIVKGCARRWGVDGYDEIGRLLGDARPAIVSVCTPDATHTFIADAVLRCPSVRGLLMEKPLATTVSDAEQTVALARERGIALAVNYSRRWGEGICEVARMLHGGQLGAIRSATGHYANGWLHNGTHWIDLARMLIGDIVAVRALDHHPTGDPNDDSLDVELEFSGGAKAIVIGHSAPGLSFFEMDIVGENGRVRLTDGAQRIEVYELAPSPTFSGFFQYVRSSQIEGGLDRALLNAVEDLSRAITGGASPACGGQDALAALRVAEFARVSTGSWTVIPAMSQ